MCSYKLHLDRRIENDPRNGSKPTKGKRGRDEAGGTGEASRKRKVSFGASETIARPPAASSPAAELRTTKKSRTHKKRTVDFEGDASALMLVIC